MLFFFQNQIFSKNSLKNTIQVSNSLDPDLARQYVGPDLGPNCLHWLSADDARVTYELVMSVYSLITTSQCLLFVQPVKFKYFVHSIFLQYKNLQMRQVLTFECQYLLHIHAQV